MISDSEIRRQIRDEVAKQANVILSGEAGPNSMDTETINNLFPGSPGVTDRPVMHPFGFASRAPAGTISVVARQGSHFGNRIVLGHRDSKKPQVQEGECVLYNISGYNILLSKTEIKIGKGKDLEPLVVGETLKNTFDSFD